MSFTDNFRSTYQGQRDQVNAENNQARADRKQGYKRSDGPGVTTVNVDPGSFFTGFVNAIRMINPLGGLTKFIPIQTIAEGAANTAMNAANGVAENVLGKSLNDVEQPQQQTEAPVTETPAQPEPEDDSEVIEYTYKPGDTFGQVIKDLGLGTANGLWGDNGDVNYYTQQLVDQGVWADGVPSNIPIGTTIKLKRRK